MMLYGNDLVDKFSTLILHEWDNVCFKRLFRVVLYILTLLCYDLTPKLLVPLQVNLGVLKGKDKGKNKLAYAPKPKILLPPKRDNPEKDFVCHHCKEVGHWRRNCPSYQAELKKRKNAKGASTSESKKLKHGALSLYVGNGMRVVVEAIGSFDLVLP
ncbi:zinc finger, CCHC-type containing protein, partial [Tanacetum coccineum]